MTNGLGILKPDEKLIEDLKKQRNNILFYKISYSHS